MLALIGIGDELNGRVGKMQRDRLGLIGCCHLKSERGDRWAYRLGVAVRSIRSTGLGYYLF